MSLKKYNQKRNFAKTTEPYGQKRSTKNHNYFAIQHHLATKDHFDLRLEINGALKSWAVPKGLSYNPKDKRLAIMVEDHPLSYKNFEGVIPKGEYGAGVVMLFDIGKYKLIKKEKDLLKFTLYGKRLKGTWSLIHLKEKNWLIIKEKDEYANKKNLNKCTTSIKTGRTLKEILNNNVIPKQKNIIETVEITNPDKIVLPNYTKLDIAKYYQKVAVKMLPYLEDRIITTVRKPNDQNIFFKKHFEPINQNLKKVLIKNKQNQLEDYYIIKNITGLIFEVQMNGYEFHIRGSKITKPDIMIFDFDPGENVSLKKLRQGVKDLKSILDQLNLVSFLKTSGNKGYHVFVPIKSFKTSEQLKQFSKDIVSLMEKKDPNIYTQSIRKDKRKNKIFIDFMRNSKSASVASPYSLRLTNAVSMPIFWEELDKIKPNEITIFKALKRIKNKDPWENFFDIDQ